MGEISEKQQQAYRSGTMFGISIAEVVLIILFVMLLLLIFSSSDAERKSQELSSERTLRQVAERKAQALENMYGANNAQDIPEDWSDLVLSYEEQVRSLTSEKNDMAEKLAQAENSNAELSDRNQELTQLAYEAQGGSTTICTYRRSDTGSGKVSVSLASIWILESGIVYLQGEIDEPSEIVDYYLNPYDPTPAIEAISEYKTGQVISDDSFESTNQKINDIGDEFETSKRANCRFAYNYYFEEEISAHRIDSFFKKYYMGYKVDKEGVVRMLESKGLDFDALAQRVGGNSKDASRR